MVNSPDAAADKAAADKAAADKAAAKKAAAKKQRFVLLQPKQEAAAAAAAAVKSPTATVPHNIDAKDCAVQPADPAILPATSPMELDSHSMDGGEVVGSLVGSGGCTAHALVADGVFASVDAAKAALNREGMAELKRRRDKHGTAYRSNKVYVRDDQWQIVVIKAVVIAAGFNFKKIDLDTVCLRDKLKSGTFFIDGTQNRHWQKGRHMYTSAPTENGPGPEERPQDWRHAIAVKDGKVLEQNDDIFPIKYLWLNQDNTVQLDKGYMRNILKAYHITKKTNSARGTRGKRKPNRKQKQQAKKARAASSA
jgi:hypothetical protein